MESLGAIRWRVRPSSSNYELQTLSDCRVRVPVPHFCVARINVFEISRLVTSLVTVNGNTVGEGMGSIGLFCSSRLLVWASGMGSAWLLVGSPALTRNRPPHCCDV